MVLHLQGRRVVRASELAKHFEITERTVYRDISALGEAGVPVIGEAGVGYSLMKGYQLPPVMFTADEATALFVGGELVKQFTDASLQAPMASALTKLRAVLPRERQDHVERLVNQTLVLGNGERHHVPDAAAQRWLLTVQQGVVARRVLKMDYRGAKHAENVTREVEPLGVVYYGGAWYLVAWCRLRADFRHFRVDRFQRLELLEEKFSHRPDFSLSEHMKTSVTRDDTIAVRVWFASEVQAHARRESHATLIEEKKTSDGAEFSLYTWSLDWMARWLLSYGGKARVVSPPKLRQLVRQTAEKVAKQHAADV